MSTFPTLEGVTFASMLPSLITSGATVIVTTAGWFFTTYLSSIREFNSSLSSRAEKLCADIDGIHLKLNEYLLSDPGESNYQQHTELASQISILAQRVEHFSRDVTSPKEAKKSGIVVSFGHFQNHSTGGDFESKARTKLDRTDQRLGDMQAKKNEVKEAIYDALHKKLYPEGLFDMLKLHLKR